MSTTMKPAERDRVDPRVWKILGVVLLGPLLTSIDSTVVNVSLSTLGRELQVGLTTLQWVVTGYLLALALMLPLSGWVVDRLGAKRVYLGCFTMFTLASLLCGIAPSAHDLIGARVLQGMAGGLLAPMAQMMVARAAPRHIARVMGVMVVPVLLGPICGPSLAGFILQHASWRWIFFINLPIGVLAIVLAAWILPRDEATEGLRSFDVRGFLLISPGLVLAMHSLESLSANPAARSQYMLEFAASIGLLAAFAVHSMRRGRAALIDVSLFKNASFLASSWTLFLLNAVSFGGQMLLPLYLLSALHISPAETGLLLAPAGLGMLCSYPSMGMMTDRFGLRRVSACGALIALLGTLAFALLSGQTLPTWAICMALFARGVGMGSIGLPSIAAAYSSISREAIPAATTAINIFQRLGGPVATTALAIFLHTRMASFSEPSSALNNVGNTRAFSATFCCSARFMWRP
ncbi:DHA2 family efflux MFS transporter permease subunit [Acidicapsa acidisoli]|uniref:DHA2 family efflux MFS transporter permease subunit n=1 Tax=Acidicapsa acidisoli TaxID=1615681 RepID=UPI0021E096E7|nr:DHA2 family efflux MFS transporter permease subunit [Acidicapsa acidisoli]